MVHQKNSETTSQFDSRGVYHQPADTIAKTFPDGQTSAYDNAEGGTTCEEAWQAVKERPWMSGMYIWTGFDYLGEPTPYNGDVFTIHSDEEEEPAAAVQRRARRAAPGFRQISQEAQEDARAALAALGPGYGRGMRNRGPAV